MGCGSVGLQLDRFSVQAVEPRFPVREAGVELVRHRPDCRNPRRAAERVAVTDERRLVLVALGGNALLRRGEPMTAEAQRANVRVAAEALAPVAERHRLVLSHGNGPQVGLLALQAAAYVEVEPYPLDILAAETEGMIGYLIEQELGNLLPFEVPFATILTMVEVDPDDPAFDDPTKFIGPVYDEAEAREARSGARLDLQAGRRRTGAASCPRPCPTRIFEHRPIKWLLEKGTIVICAGGGGIPTMYVRDGARTLRRRGGGHRQGPCERAARAGDRGRRVRDGHGRRRASTSIGARRMRGRLERTDAASCGRTTSPLARWGRRWRPPATSSSAPGGTAAIGALADIEAIVDGRAGTIVQPG